MANNLIQVGPIGMGEDPFTSEVFSGLLAECSADEDLVLEYHSSGGSVLEGFRMHGLIEEWPGRTIARIKVAAFSIASYMAMASDEIEIARNGFFMIHNPYSNVEGDDKELMQQAKFLTDLKLAMIESYCDRTGISEKEIQAMMRETTYIGAEDAVSMGFADRIIERADRSPESLKPVASAFRRDGGKHPLVVLAAMFPQADGSNVVLPKEDIDVSQKTLATSKQIRGAFPKASSDFILACLDRELAMGDVSQEYASDMESKLAEAMEKITAMEDENASLKEELASLKEEPTADDDDGDDEETKPNGPTAKGKVNPKASGKGRKPSGAAPIGNVSGKASGDADPAGTWNGLVQGYVDKGLSRVDAVRAASKANPVAHKAFIGAANK